jgi:hypothetical protein
MCDRYLAGTCFNPRSRAGSERRARVRKVDVLVLIRAAPLYFNELLHIFVTDYDPYSQFTHYTVRDAMERHGIVARSVSAAADQMLSSALVANPACRVGGGLTMAQCSGLSPLEWTAKTDCGPIGRLIQRSNAAHSDAQPIDLAKVATVARAARNASLVALRGT